MPVVITAALKDYFEAWRTWAASIKQLPGLDGLLQLRPANLGWNVATIADFNAQLAVWVPLSSQLHVISTVDNENWR